LLECLLSPCSLKSNGQDRVYHPPHPASFKEYPPATSRERKRFHFFHCVASVPFLPVRSREETQRRAARVPPPAQSSRGLAGRGRGEAGEQPQFLRWARPLPWQVRMDGSPCLPIGLTQPRHFRPGVVQPHPLRRGMALLRQMRATLPLPAKRGAALSPLAWHNPSAACDPLHNRTLLGKTAPRFYFLIIYSLFLFCCPLVIGVLESSSESCQKKNFSVFIR
jgi:hypothetical protein